MSENTQDAYSSFKKNKVFVVLVLSLLVIFVPYITYVSYGVVISDKIYAGIFVDGISAKNMSKDDLKKILKSKFRDDNSKKVFTLNVKRFSETISFEKAKLNFDIDDSVEKAHKSGRTGDFSSRFIDLMFNKHSPTNIKTAFTYDKKYVDAIIQSVSKQVYVPLKEHQIFASDPETYFIDFGHHGESIDTIKLLNTIEQNFQDYKTLDINLIVEKQNPKELTVDYLYKKLNKEPVDASIGIKNNAVWVNPPINGLKIEKAVLKEILSKSKNLENKRIPLPVKIIQAKIKSEELKSKLFRDSLSYFSTQFYTGSTNNDNRKQNIIIAASKINGKVIGAGQVFSFNKVVGPRTPEYGYKDAHAYIGGKVVDSTGGGICQVSTTLYNAILFADLNIVERHNHMFTVGYVPKGRDAAVAYGSSDFQFKNNTNMPIKVFCSISPDNKVHFSIVGTKTNPLKSVDFWQSIVKEIPFEVENIDDPTLPIGQTQITEQGMTGFVVDTYKIVKENGIVVSETKLHTSNYKPLSKQIKIGVKQASSPDTLANPANVTKGVDDAYNPPINSQ